MQKFFLFLFLLSSSFSYGQYDREKQYKPFKVAIILPDTVKLVNSLQQFLDTIPKAHLDKTFIGIKRSEVSYSPDSGLTLAEYEAKMKKSSDEAFEREKAEAGINYFKPAQLIAKNTSDYLKEWFKSKDYKLSSGLDKDGMYKEKVDSSHWVLSTQIISDRTNKTLNQLKKISTSLKSDYIIYFKNISTFEVKVRAPKIKITAVLYSTKENKILYEKETITEIDKDYLWTYVNPLNVLLQDGVACFDPKIYSILEKKQRK